MDTVTQKMSKDYLAGRGLMAPMDAPAPGDVGNTNGEASDPRVNPFDPERLRKAYATASVVGVKRTIIKIPVKRPDRYLFIRTHPDRQLWLPVGTLELKEERETYLIAPELFDFLRGYGAARRILIPCISRSGQLFVWPIRLPDEDGRIDSWSESALEIATMAIENWLSLASNREAGCYEAIVAELELAEPKWPAVSLSEMIKLGFKGRQIDREDHPVVQRILGKQ